MTDDGLRYHAPAEKYTVLRGNGFLYTKSSSSYMTRGDTQIIPWNEPHAFVALEAPVILMFEINTGPFAKIQYTYTGETIRR
jgi:mannose-6-phosphate isomerase-like protein (cupin superfamily)